MDSLVKYLIVALQALLHAGGNLVIGSNHLLQFGNLHHQNDCPHSLGNIPDKLHLMVVHMLTELLLPGNHNGGFPETKIMPCPLRKYCQD